jgi:pimeloyl-ACP methyl ester carboxylesterase
MKLPPPGRMIDLGGRRMHVQISGESGPSVVLESGLAATSLTWALVQPLIAPFARVMSYDRAGLGWSDDATGAATALNAVQDLELLLDRAGLSAPFILVGHSFGALIARILQQRHPELVAGLVLVDPVVRDEWREPTPQRRAMLGRGVMLSRRGATLARIGVVRFALTRLTSGSQRVPGLLGKIFAGGGAGTANRLVGEVRKIPREHWPAVAAHWSEERAFRTMAGYLENLPLSVSQLDEHRPLGDLPIVILSSGNSSPEGLAEHERDVRLSTRGEHIVVPNTGHWINLDAPGIIADAVRRIL